MAWDDMVNSGWFGAGAAGVGGLADLYTAINNSQARNQQGDIYKILSDPAKLAAYVQSYNKPMGAAENTAIRRDIGSQWAPMTGGATGGALSQFIADALAKIETQRSQAGAGQAIGALQGSLGAIPNQQPMGNLAGVMKALMTLQQIRGASAGQQKIGQLSETPGWAAYRAGEIDPGAYIDSSAVAL